MNIEKITKNITVNTVDNEYIIQETAQETAYIAPSGIGPMELMREINVQKPHQYLWTLNSHGSYSAEQFILPEDVYVLVPHPQGFDAFYVLNSPPNSMTVEEMLYTKAGAAFPDASSGGWHLYEPGQKVNNLQLAPWTGNEYQNWLKTVPKSDAADIQAGDLFAIVPARDKEKKALYYQNEQKYKVKIFSPTNLKTVIEAIRAKSPKKPIILIPLACNHKPGAKNESINLSDQQSQKNIEELFSKLSLRDR